MDLYSISYQIGSDNSLFWIMQQNRKIRQQRVLKDLQIKYILVAENMLIFTQLLREKYIIYAIINVLKRVF